MIKLNSEFKLLMHFDNIKYNKLRGGIKMILQHMINNEFEVKIKDKQLVQLLRKLPLPK